MNVYKINDLINCAFLKIPKAMFVMEEYRRLSSDAKLTYALLYDRLALSKMNNWINERDEVFLIYTREDIAADLGITYKKAISAFRELAAAGLIFETRSGRGLANKIYIVKLEATAEQAKKAAAQDNTRTAESAYLKTGTTGTAAIELPDGKVKNCRFGTSRTAGVEGLDLPKQHPNQNKYNHTKKNQMENSQSLYPGDAVYLQDGEADNAYKLEEILENCQLACFGDTEQKILYDAIERLFYSETFKIGNAVLPQDKVRSRLYQLDAAILQNALHSLHQNRDRPVKNITAYVMSVIFNSITEEYSLLHVDPYLNSFRQEGGRGCVSECVPAVYQRAD